MNHTSISPEELVAESFFDIEFDKLHEIHRDFDGCKEEEIEDGSVFIRAIIETCASPVYDEEFGVYCAVELSRVTVLDAYLDGEKVNRKEVQRLINQQ